MRGLRVRLPRLALHLARCHMLTMGCFYRGISHSRARATVLVTGDKGVTQVKKSNSASIEKWIVAAQQASREIDGLKTKILMAQDEERREEHRSNAEHEAGHATIALLMGTEIFEVAIYAEGGGHCNYRNSLTDMQRILVKMSGFLASGW